MARRKDSPQKTAMREMMRHYLRNNDISTKDGTDVNSIMRNMMTVFLEGVQDKELGYFKYDYHNKEADNSKGCIIKRAVYIALGIDMNGKKDVLGIYVGENESAKFWFSIMNDLKNRSVEDILIACADGLNGFLLAIKAVYPKAETQQCIIHQIRNSTRFVSI